MDEVFKALADPTRRLLLDRLRERNGQTLGQLCSGIGATRQTITKHLEILEHAKLVATRRQGREKLHFLNEAPIYDIAERWINPYHQRHVAVLAALKTALETKQDET